MFDRKLNIIIIKRANVTAAYTITREKNENRKMHKMILVRFYSFETTSAPFSYVRNTTSTEKEQQFVINV